jgi:hypothetical protein
MLQTESAFPRVTQMVIMAQALKLQLHCDPEEHDGSVGFVRSPYLLVTSSWPRCNVLPKGVLPPAACHRDCNRHGRFNVSRVKRAPVRVNPAYPKSAYINTVP